MGPLRSSQVGFAPPCLRYTHKISVADTHPIKSFPDPTPWVKLDSRARIDLMAKCSKVLKMYRDEKAYKAF